MVEVSLLSSEVCTLSPSLATLVSINNHLNLILGIDEMNDISQNYYKVILNSDTFGEQLARNFGKIYDIGVDLYDLLRQDDKTPLSEFTAELGVTVGKLIYQIFTPRGHRT